MGAHAIRSHDFLCRARVFAFRRNECRGSKLSNLSHKSISVFLLQCARSDSFLRTAGGMKHPLTDIPAPAVGVTASAVWPDNPDKRVVLGEPRVSMRGAQRLSCATCASVRSRRAYR